MALAAAIGHGRATDRTDTNVGRIVVADPCGAPNPSLVTAAGRAGAVGLLDLPAGADRTAVLAELSRRRTPTWWVRPAPGVEPADVAALTDGLARPSAVVLAGDRPGLAGLVAGWSAVVEQVLVQVVSRQEAVEAVAAGAHGLLASGREAGGRVGPTEAFVLLQQLLDLGVPVWLRGGIGLHTGPAALAGGAAGVVVDVQTGLLRESGLGSEARRALTAADGSQTRVIGGHRVFTRPDLPAASLDAGTDPAEVASRLGRDLRCDLLPWGQDAALAPRYAERYGTVGGLVQALAAALDEHPVLAAEQPPLAPGAGVAASHGTTYPVVQGPMTRVSDSPAFAAAVAAGGGLPLLALALLPADRTRSLLTETASLVSDRPWGVGLLGFAPPELLAAQLEVVREVRPPWALIAGGRPGQAADLEAAGVPAYLHVPSPGLLDRFLEDGARRFVFEGRECGGHVGPLSSHTLWEAQLDRLAEVPDPESLHVLLAGGIHDARSAAMAAVALAPLAARGASVGVLMGTAYLFTSEAVGAGAIEETFQQVVRDCEETALVETAPGHATRCVETGFVRAFTDRARELEEQGVAADARWAELEQLNLGRLRLAAKGVERTEQGLVPVDSERQRAEGMYMIGEVATLRSRTTTVAALHRDVSDGSTAYLADRFGPGARPADRPAVRVTEEAPPPLDVAVVGLSTMLPGSTDVDGYWADVVAGRDRVGEVPPERWNTDLYYDPDAYDGQAGRRSPSKWGGFLDPVGFDPLAYGIPPAALASVEPVQLLALEAAARALADAGYARRRFDRSRASVVFGAESGNDLSGMYGLRAWLPDLLGRVPDELDDWLPSLTEDSFPGVLANVIAGRIANRLDLGGVNYTVDAACASSLAALDAGCKELVAGSSDLVLVGGADLHNGLNDYLMFSSVHALSPTGRCRTFDASADGIALGEGVACVVLKRLADAERDGDRIYAVLDAVSGSSDGRHLGLTAPRKEGQQRAVVRALAQAGAAATDLGLVEAHGTGTVVGDRTEMATLTELFAEAGAAPGSAVLGSVKSQIGHTKCTAGLAGLVKVVKAVHHGVLPPTIHLDEPNPYYDAATSPFRFLDRPRPWAEESRRAGVSAFGFGGTNFHAVVSSYTAGDGPAHKREQWPCELFLLRGRTPEDARRTATELAEKVAGVLATDPQGQRHRLRDLGATLAEGTHPVQTALVADSWEELATQLSRVGGGTDHRAGVWMADDELAAPGASPTVAFLYPGQGSQRPGMLEELFTTFTGLDDLLRTGRRWTDAMFPPAAFTREERAAQQAAVTATDIAQPTLGLAASAMTRLLGRAGVHPAMAAGHSYGELAALAAAGSFDEATLLEMSAARGESILQAVADSGGDPGTMAAVALPLDDVYDLIADRPTLVVANHNGPRQVVLAGPTQDVQEAAAEWESAGIKVTLLPVACAFHSPLVATAGTAFAERLADLDLRAPRFPVWSNATAAPYPDGPDAAGRVAELLVDQVTAGVRFVEQVEAMYAAGARVFVEAGPGRVLTQQVGRILGDRPHRVVACDAAGESGLRRFLMALGELATLGVPVDPAMLFEGRTARADLAAWPLPAPGWTVDGAFVRRADGTPVPGSLRPIDTLPRLDLSRPDRSGGPVTHAAAPLSPGAAGPDPSAVVQEYLRGVRELVAAERDVMLRYLGAEVPAAVAVASDVPVAAAAVETPAAPDPATPAVTEAAAAVPELTEDALLAVVQRVVADRTGYPVEMLEPDLDLEADLSIDSIKRLEIVGEVAEQLGLADAAGPAEDDAVVEELARHKTLRALVTWLVARLAVVPDGTGTPTGVPTRASDVLTEAQLLVAAQQVVADRTGYPVEMLEPDLDLEADLSIDSIKRLEVVGELVEQLGLASVGGPDQAEDEVVEELARHKTLAALVAWVHARLGGDQAPTAPAAPAPTGAGAPAAATAPAGSLEVPSQRTEAPAGPGPTQVRELVVEPLGPTVPIGDLTATSVALVAGDPGLTLAVRAALVDRGARVQVLDPGREDVSVLGGSDAVLDLGATLPWHDARAVFGHLRPALLGGATALVAVSVAVHPDDVPTGVPGLMRSLAREYPDAVVRSVEVEAEDLEGDLAPLAAAVVDELLDHDGPASLSWAGGHRTTRVLGEPRAVPAPGRLDLDREAVVLLTGGARGITARTAEAIARHSGCHLVLVGRTPLPGAEDPRLADARDRTELRRTLLGIGELGTPAEIEAACQRVLAEREVRDNLAALERVAASVEYHSVDVRSPDLAALLDDVRARHGRLDVLVHGAGVLDDRFVADKTPDGFDRVYGTKVDGARTLLAQVPAGVRTVLFFGSVSGVLGNRGQSDYAAANDALDALARHYDGEGGARVISLDWGPWAGGGMVSDDLERDYARRGIGLVDPADGTAVVLAALAGEHDACQWVVMRGAPEAFAAPRSGARTASVEA